MNKHELKEVLENGSPLEHPLFIKAIKRFEEQYDVELDCTGYWFPYSDNDGLGSVEYWCNGLISSPAKELDIKVGGWIDHDTRDNENNIYLLFAVQINGETLGDCEGLQCWYDKKTGRWDDLTWDSY